MCTRKNSPRCAIDGPAAARAAPRARVAPCGRVGDGAVCGGGTRARACERERPSRCCELLMDLILAVVEAEALRNNQAL